MNTRCMQTHWMRDTIKCNVYIWANMKRLDKLKLQGNCMVHSGLKHSYLNKIAGTGKGEILNNYQENISSQGNVHLY